MAIEMKKTRVKMKKTYFLACQYQILAKHLCINFGMITLNQIIETGQTYVTFMLKLNIL